MATVGAPAVPAEKGGSLQGARLVAGYVAVAGFLVAAIVTSLSVGHHRHAAPAVAGFYSSSAACLGKSFSLNQSGEFVDLGGGPSGKLRLRGDHLKGTAHCLGGTAAALDLVVAGTKLDRHDRRYRSHGEVHGPAAGAGRLVKAAAEADE